MKGLGAFSTLKAKKELHYLDQLRRENKHTAKNLPAPLGMTTNSTASMEEESTLSANQISRFSADYKQRRKQQMLRFFGATAVTLISCRMAYRGVQSRRCMFESVVT